MEVLSEKSPKARKEYRCDLCTGTIEVGTTYTRRSICSDGSVSDFVIHKECDELATVTKLYEESPCGVSSDDFKELLSNYFDYTEGNEYEFAKLILKNVNYEIEY